MNQVLTVGQVAKRCGVKVSAIHFYEQRQLITSTRTLGNQRRYSRDVLRRISIIKAAQKLGITLEEIKLAFDKLPNKRTPNKEDWQHLSSYWQKALTERINQMMKLKESLTGCIGCGCLSMTKCPLYNPDDKLSEMGVGPVLLNAGKSSD